MCKSAASRNAKSNHLAHEITLLRIVESGQLISLSKAGESTWEVQTAASTQHAAYGQRG